MSQGFKPYQGPSCRLPGLARGLAAALAVLFALAAQTGCSSKNMFLGRKATAEAVAAPAGLAELDLDGGRFTVHGYARGGPAETLTVYVEGDGFAWANKTTPSDDPTPKDPAALRLAARDPSPAVAYLARPCQYPGPGDAPGCEPYYWTFGRFSPPVLSAMDKALDALKARFQASRLRLVGFSGGGAVAVLLAAKRDDVAFVATVAGNLDTALWCRLHNISPLAGSLNPADFAAEAAHIPQVHFVGGRDTNIPRAVADSYAARASSPGTVKVVVIPDNAHACCWETNWPQLIRDYFPR